jgi:hypothetical protein
MATLSSLKERLIRLLGDTIEAGSSPLGGKLYSADLLADGIRAGLDAILQYVPDIKTVDFVQIGTQNSYSLPADLYRIEAIQSLATGEYIQELNFFEDRLADLLWLDAPTGYVTFSYTLPTNGIRMYYSAKWSSPSGDNDTIASPGITHVGILLYAASYCKLPRAGLASMTRQYLSKEIDSGTPIMNPEMDASTYFLKRYEDYMRQLPAIKKGMR